MKYIISISWFWVTIRCGTSDFSRPSMLFYLRISISRKKCRPTIDSRCKSLDRRWRQSVKICMFLIHVGTFKKKCLINRKSFANIAHWPDVIWSNIFIDSDNPFNRDCLKLFIFILFESKWIMNFRKYFVV